MYRKFLHSLFQMYAIDKHKRMPSGAILKNWAKKALLKFSHLKSHERRWKWHHAVGMLSLSMDRKPYESCREMN